MTPPPVAPYAPIGLDLWVALGNDSNNYDYWLERLGWADLWAHLIASVERLLAQPGSLPNRAPWHQRTSRLCPTRTPEVHQLGEFPMSCYPCHIEADS